jgi:hypothetical protein
MSGRAGLLQFNSDGETYLIITSDKLSLYRENLNKIDSLRTVTCKGDAILWFKHTFYYI